jgi:hypothetical protein
MQTRRWSTSLRVVAAAGTALFVGACSGDSPRLTDPLDAPVQFTDVPPVTIWKVNVCKVMEGGGNVTFTTSATSGTVLLPTTSVPAANSINDPPSCKLVWQGTPGEAVTVTITEATSPFYELEQVIARNMPGPGISLSGYTVTLNQQYMAEGAAGGEAIIIFKNRPLTPPPGLTATKTAAGTFEIPVRWELVKTVTPTSHSGTAGQNAGNSTWTVTATRIEGAATNHRVTGTITVSNPADGVSRNFTVTDVVGGVAATVSCPANTVAPGASVVCSYSANVAGATLNTATVSSPGLPDLNPTAAVSYTGSFTGDQTVTLADPRFSYSTAISSTTTAAQVRVVSGERGGVGLGPVVRPA